jgi:hypothetical protein
MPICWLACTSLPLSKHAAEKIRWQSFSLNARHLAVRSQLSPQRKQPLISVPRKDVNVFELCRDLVAKLKSHPEVTVRASGESASFRLLVLTALAEQDLHRSSGFLPDFGRLALRIDGPSSSQGARLVPDTLNATVARLLDVPVAADSLLPVVSSRRSDVAELSAALAERLVGESGEHILDQHAAEIRFVGAKAGLQAMRGIFSLEQRLGVSVDSLGLAPSLGAALSLGSLEQMELLVSIYAWTKAAPVVTIPILMRQKQAWPFAIRPFVDDS